MVLNDEFLKHFSYVYWFNKNKCKDQHFENVTPKQEPSSTFP